VSALAPTGTPYFVARTTSPGEAGATVSGSVVKPAPAPGLTKAAASSSPSPAIFSSSIQPSRLPSRLAQTTTTIFGSSPESSSTHTCRLRNARAPSFWLATTVSAAWSKPYLEAVAAQIDALDDREADLVADNFCRLLAVTCGAAAGEHKESIRAARLEEAKRYIGLHLADPELTPEKAAGALKVSVRQLHLLFEPSGTTFGQYVLRRRLEECRAALMNPISSRSVTDVAFAWGFNNLWTFNRNFRRAFGVAPGEMRRDAPAPGSSG
jgi:AraC-like DNA-binding protein